MPGNLLEGFPGSSGREPWQGLSAARCSARICILERFPRQQFGCPCFMSRVTLLGSRVGGRQRPLSAPRAGSCGNICTEHATAFGAVEELRAETEMKPIMGFLNICFILALNARPLVTPCTEFYCVQVHGHRRTVFGEECVKQKWKAPFEAALSGPAGQVGCSWA